MRQHVWALEALQVVTAAISGELDSRAASKQAAAELSATQVSPALKVPIV